MRCTHCPLVYHVDCLDEPVTAVVVKGAWMCPNHPERVMSRRKKARLSTRRMLDPANANADAVKVKLDFISKMARERGLASTAVEVSAAGPAEPSEADKRAFTDSIVKMHEEWWASERTPIGSAGRVVDAVVAATAAQMPVGFVLTTSSGIISAACVLSAVLIAISLLMISQATVALGADVGSMSDAEKQATILRLRRLVNADVRESVVARVQLDSMPPRRAERVQAAGDLFPSRELPEGCVATLVSCAPLRLSVEIPFCCHQLDVTLPHAPRPLYSAAHRQGRCSLS